MPQRMGSATDYISISHRATEPFLFDDVLRFTIMEVDVNNIIYLVGLVVVVLAVLAFFGFR
jgi:hypothetical protein